MDGKELVQIGTVLQKRQRVVFSPLRLAEQFSEKCLDGLGLFSFLQAFDDRLIFLVQIDLDVSCKSNDLGTVIHALL